MNDVAKGILQAAIVLFGLYSALKFCTSVCSVAIFARNRCYHFYFRPFVTLTELITRYPLSERNEKAYSIIESGFTYLAMALAALAIWLVTR